KAAAGSAALTVDLTDVNYCDSAAVRALFAVAASTELTMVVAAAGPIRTLLGISGLDRVATVVTGNETRQGLKQHAHPHFSPPRITF
ncbi:MAG TPA: STAS domain-containing protein, partial [Mycobacterium sp.]|nr:STAS domain-containing protein [Mycobacterium sp.]